jgi:hypothetical protein
LWLQVGAFGEENLLSKKGLQVAIACVRGMALNGEYSVPCFDPSCSERLPVKQTLSKYKNMMTSELHCHHLDTTGLGAAYIACLCFYQLPRM